MKMFIGGAYWMGLTLLYMLGAGVRVLGRACCGGFSGSGSLSRVFWVRFSWSNLQFRICWVEFAGISSLDCVYWVGIAVLVLVFQI